MQEAGEEERLRKLTSAETWEREQAWAHLYKTLYPVVTRSILEKGANDSDAVDVFQDALLALNNNLINGTYRGESSLKTYVLAIARNIWLRTLAKRRLRLSPLEDAEHVEEDTIFYLKNVDAVRTLLSELDEDCRRILIEYYYNNRSMEELKELFGVSSVQAAKNKKWRCLGYLLRLFKEKKLSYIQESEREGRH